MAATPPPRTIERAPVSSAARIVFETRTSTTDSWKPHASSATVASDSLASGSALAASPVGKPSPTLAWSIVRRRRVRANLWIGGGALVVALATGLSRAGSYDLVYAGELLGIALMFAGFAFVGKAGRKPQPSTQSRVRYSQKASPA